MQAQEPSVELHIEELVLDGFGWIDQAQIGAVVRQELARLLAESGAPPVLKQGGNFADYADIDAGSVVAGPTTDAASLGREIAQAVYRGIEHG